MKKILLVEDDDLLNKTLTYNLISEGYDTVSALNAGRATELLTQTEYDLVLLDINLPDGSGYDLCRLIKPENPDTLVIFLTANDQESDQIRGYEAGAVDYITKPFSRRATRSGDMKSGRWIISPSPFLLGRCCEKYGPCSPCWNTGGWQRISMMTAGCFWTFRNSPLR